jgi:hypothetical protein
VKREAKVVVAIFTLVIAVILIAHYRQSPIIGVAECGWDEGTVYDADKTVFPLIFKEPVETLFCMTVSGVALVYSSLEEYSVRLHYDEINQTLKRRNMTIADILYVVHNHFGMTRMSEQDKTFFHYLINRGFRGFFAIYSQGSKKIEVWRVICQ